MNDIKIGAVYEHYSGKRYKVLDIVRDSETLDFRVEYQALYDCEKFGSNSKWSRPLSMFAEHVVIQGQEVPRFKLVTQKVEPALEIYYATSNSGKFAEVKNYLAEFAPHISLKQFDRDLPEIQTLDQRAIAVNKAQQAWNILQKPVLVDDAGVFCEKYNQFPGTLTKFVYEGIGFEGLLKLLEHNDKAAFVLQLVYMTGPDDYHVFEGRCEGRIVHPGSFDAPPSLPYCAIFAPTGSEKTLSQLMVTGEDRNYNHRIQALKKFLAWHSENRFRVYPKKKPRD